MFRFLILIFFIPFIVNGQSAWQPTKEMETAAYCDVISEYLNVYKNDKPTFDTLFIGKHEEFPDIQLPALIQNTKIALMTNAEGEKRKKCSKPFTLINVVNDEFMENKTNFIIVNFISFHPQHNCYIDLKYNSVSKKFELAKKIRFDDSIYKKK